MHGEQRIAAYWRAYLEFSVDHSSPRAELLGEIDHAIASLPADQAAAELRHIANAAPSDAALAFLGAGPIENFILHEDEGAVLLLVREAKDSPALLAAMRSVWVRPESVSSEKWRLLAEALGEGAGTE